jgi:hypothetical protein
MGDVRRIKVLKENGDVVSVPLTTAARYALYQDLREEFEDQAEPQSRLRQANSLEILLD